MRRTTKRLLLSLLIGPLVIIPANFFWTLMLMVFMPREGLTFVQLFGALIVSAAELMPSYVFALFYWLPVYLLLSRYKKDTLTTMTIASVLPGLLFLILPQKSMLLVVMMSYFFVCIGLACWYIARSGKK